MERTPASLLERLRQPDAEAAWARFVELYTPLLFHWARRAGVAPQDVGDLVQDVLTQLVRKLSGFDYDAGRSFRAWLRTVMLNRVREVRRRAGARVKVAGPAVDDVAADDDGSELEEAEYRQWLVQRTLTVLAPEFPKLTWQAFQEYMVSGRDAAEVAATLGLSVGSVYAAKSRVLTRLRQELNGLLD